MTNFVEGASQIDTSQSNSWQSILPRTESKEHAGLNLTLVRSRASFAVNPFQTLYVLPISFEAQASRACEIVNSEFGPQPF